MQEIINKIQSGDITTNKLLQDLTTYNDKVVDEFNEVMDALDERNGTLEQQSEVLEKQHQALLKQDADKEIYIKNQGDLKKQSVAFQLENKTIKHQLDVAKKEIKSQKEQIKRNKAAMKARDAKIAKLEKQVKQGNKANTELVPLTTVYSKGEAVLQIYPQQLELGINGKRRKQVALIYTNRKGCFVTAFLDNDNKVAFSSFINDSADIAERTKALINKNTMQVPDGAVDFAQTWLYRVNVIQKMTINPIDLTCHKN